MTKGEQVLAVAAREIGYHESAGKRNKFGAYYRCDGMAWCMFFVQWCYEQAGLKLPRFTGSCGDLLRWYRANQPECVTEDPVPGCIVIFDFPGGAATDHTGLFVSRTGAKVTTIDGNTSGVNQSNGGWVQQKTRAVSYARPTYIIPRELREERTGAYQAVPERTGAKPAGQETEGEMRRYDTIDEIRDALPWAVPTVEKLIERDILRGNGKGLDLSEDMVRIFVFNDRAGLYG